MPFTSFTEARDEIALYFETEWNLQAGTPPPIYWDDKDKDLPKIDLNDPLVEDEFVSFNMRHNDDVQRTLGGIGQRRYEQFGVITIQIFVKPGDGLANLDTFGKIAVDIFKGKSTGSDRVLFTRSRYNEIGRSGNWNQGNVSVDFVYELIA